MTAFQSLRHYHAVELSIDDARMENVRMSCCRKYRHLKTRNGMTVSASFALFFFDNKVVVIK